MNDNMDMFRKAETVPEPNGESEPINPRDTDISAHIDLSTADPPKPADDRVTLIERGRAHRADSPPEAPPLEVNAVMVTELQEIKDRIDVIGSAAMAALLLLGMIAGALYATQHKGLNSNG